MADGAGMAAAFNGQPGYSAVPSVQPSPPATPGGGVVAMQGTMPDGRSPNGKRPRAKVDGEAGTVNAPLSLQELTDAVYAIQPYLESTAGAVGYNCNLLNALVGRVNSIEATSAITISALEKLVERVNLNR